MYEGVLYLLLSLTSFEGVGNVPEALDLALMPAIWSLWRFRILSCPGLMEGIWASFLKSF